MLSEFEHETKLWESWELQRSNEYNASGFDEFWGGTGHGIDEGGVTGFRTSWDQSAMSCECYRTWQFLLISTPNNCPSSKCLIPIHLTQIVQTSTWWSLLTQDPSWMVPRFIWGCLHWCDQKDVRASLHHIMRFHFPRVLLGRWYWGFHSRGDIKDNDNHNNRDTFQYEL